jgi:hypothetical protein
MVDTPQKRNRDRKQREKRHSKEERRHIRAEAKLQRLPRATMSSPGGEFPLENHAGQQGGQPIARSEGNQP